MILCKLGIHRWKTEYVEHIEEHECDIHPRSSVKNHSGQIKLFYNRKGKIKELPYAFIGIQSTYYPKDKIFTKTRICKWCHKKQGLFNNDYPEVSLFESGDHWVDSDLSKIEVRDIKLEKILND